MIRDPQLNPPASWSKTDVMQVGQPHMGPSVGALDKLGWFVGVVEGCVDNVGILDGAAEGPTEG